MQKIKPDGKRNDCPTDAIAGAPSHSDHIDRPPPSEAIIAFVQALARVHEKIDYEEAKAAWLAKQHIDR